MAKPLKIGGRRILPGQRTIIDLPLARLYTHSEISIPVQIIRGKKDGARLFVSAAVHGDEINGVEIIRRLLKMPLLKDIRGTLIAVPVVNVYGFLNRSRYLPDRRDLNRTFPGSRRGSLTARLAYLFMKEIVDKCTHGIDIHTGAFHRCNLPHVRACLEEPETMRLARAFGAPLMLNAFLRDGSLREAVKERGLPMLLYEGGEVLRFDETAIRVGVHGIIHVMQAIGMLKGKPSARIRPVMANSSFWIRAPGSGILRADIRLGDRISRGQLLGLIADPFGEKEVHVHSPDAGILIGRTNLPLVNEGEALFHIASFKSPKSILATLKAFRDEMEPELTREDSLEETRDV